MKAANTNWSKMAELPNLCLCDNLYFNCGYGAGRGERPKKLWHKDRYWVKPANITFKCQRCILSLFCYLPFKFLNLHLCRYIRILYILSNYSDQFVIVLSSKEDILSKDVFCTVGTFLHVLIGKSYLVDTLISVNWKSTTPVVEAYLTLK